jgi:hypothetical protein
MNRFALEQCANPKRNVIIEFLCWHFRSQLQLQQIRNCKELTNTQRLKQQPHQQQALVAPSTSLSNGVVIDPAPATAATTSAAAASKQQKLKQHLVQKIHQQQLQMQLQQLQTLQQQQQQQRQQQQQQHIAFQQQQQVSDTGRSNKES